MRTSLTGGEMVFTAIVILTMAGSMFNILRVEDNIKARFNKAMDDAFFFHVRTGGKHIAYLDWNLKVAKTMSYIMLYVMHLIAGTVIIGGSYIILL